MTQDKGKAVNGIHLAEQLVISTPPQSCALKASAVEHSTRLIKCYRIHNTEGKALLAGHKERTLPSKTSLGREVKRTDS